MTDKQQPTLGQLVSESMRVNLVSQIPGMNDGQVADLVNDRTYPNCVPVYTMRNALRLLAISTDAAIMAMRETFKRLQAEKNRPRTPHSSLWENDEALGKYTQRLQELMTVGTTPASDKR